MARVRRRRGINNGRRPVNHHRGGLRIRNLIPAKPRKPASAFNLFVRDYFRTTMGRQFRTVSKQGNSESCLVQSQSSSSCP